MPYTDIGEGGQDWPIPNKQFEITCVEPIEDRGFIHEPTLRGI
jgi:hypothetical protein